MDDSIPTATKIFVHHPDLGPDTMPDALRDMGHTDGLPPPPISYSGWPETPVPAALPTMLKQDLLEYTVLLERHMRLHKELELEQLKMQEIARQQNENGAKLGELLDALGTKYNVDFHTHRIQPDGSIIPLK